MYIENLIGKIKMLKLKDAHRLQKLFCKDSQTILAGLSSEYCEEDKKEFKENYGCSFKEMLSSIEELRKIINK